MDRLSRAALAGLPPAVRRPRHDVAALAPGIVHLGLGAFARAHQAVYVDDCLDAGEAGWGIVGASLRSPATRDALAPQDGLYAVLERGPEGASARVVGALHSLLVAPENPGALLDRLADPRTRIVTLTVTEKGYLRDPATGALDHGHPDVAHDLASPHAPRSAPGFLVEAIARRRAAGTAPFAVLPCDNLPANGRSLARVLVDLARRRDPDLAAYLAGEVACPSCVVDRIVPATTDEDRADAARLLEAEDAWPVVAEPFSQWVVEDRFPAGRPHLERAGVEFVADVGPHELAKLRLLNGAHSALAALGLRAGLATVAVAVADPALNAYAAALTAEAAATVPLETAAYRAALLARFANPGLRHRLSQIAVDGSQKLPQRLLGSARDRLARGLPIPCLALAVAAWMHHLAGADERGGALALDDPLAATLRPLARGPGPVGALLGTAAVFGDLGAEPRFRAAVACAHAALAAGPAREAAARAAGTS